MRLTYKSALGQGVRSRNTLISFSMIIKVEDQKWRIKPPTASG